MRDNSLVTEEPLGLYLSVPFCRAKCTFCNFASGVYPASAMPAYVHALEQQLRLARVWAQSVELALPSRVDTVYLGGGTPSLLPPHLITQLFRTIRDEFTLDADAEITLEAAPLQLDPATLEAAMAAGVNRVSFGVQSFVDGEARATARTHSGREALAELDRVRRAGIEHLSADLIAGLPGQTGASWAASVRTLAAAPVDHASVYMFELDGDSRLGAEALGGGTRYGAALLPQEDRVADWYVEACEHLAAAGLAQYEISNFARHSGRSRHNERYWLRQPYLGLGVDAHSMLRGLAGSAARFAVRNELSPFLQPKSLDAPGWSRPQWLTRAEELEECWFLGLRRTAGVALPTLEAAFSKAAVAPYLPVLAELADNGLLSTEDGVVSLTTRGRLLSNEVFGALLAIPDPMRQTPDPELLAASPGFA